MAVGVLCARICLPNHFCIFRADGAPEGDRRQHFFSVAPAAGDSSRVHCHHSFRRNEEKCRSRSRMSEVENLFPLRVGSMAARATIGRDEVDRRKDSYGTLKWRLVHQSSAT